MSATKHEAIIIDPTPHPDVGERHYECPCGWTGTKRYTVDSEHAVVLEASQEMVDHIRESDPTYTPGLM